MINWEEELGKRGFVLLYGLLRNYGNGIFTGSIFLEKKGSLGEHFPDPKTKDSQGLEIFVPFIASEDKEKREHNSIRLRTLEELDDFILQRKQKKENEKPVE
jgi:hypothetical protein